MTRKELLEQLGESEDGGIVGILPSVVLLDAQLPVSARLLYGVITWRCGRKNACTWASNKELGQDIGLTAKRVSELVLLLQQRGHVETEIERDEETGEVLRRLIYPQMQSGRGIPKKTDTLSRNFGGGIPKNREVLRKKKKVIKKDTPPTPPDRKIKLDEDARPLLNDYVRGDRAMAEAMMDLMEIRTAKKAVNSYRGIKNLLAELDRLSGGDREMKLLLLQQSAANGWKSVFPLRVNSRAAPASGGKAEKVKSELSTWTDD